MEGNATEKILDELSTRRANIQSVIIAREREMRESCSSLKAVDIRIARACLNDKASLKELLIDREKIVADWLTAFEKPKDWLTPQYGCKACMDTGYVDGKLCMCVRNEAAARMFTEAGMTANSPSFEKFDASLFSDTRLTSGYSIRSKMLAICEYALAYSNKFPNNSVPNLLFTGKPGLGKTFLMDCIAGRVISRGHWVVRATAFGVNDVMAKALFDRADPDSLFDCDLLALDDLGSEPLLNKVTISSMFSLLNERMAKGKPFIISTNLTPEEILKRYGERIFSRMTDARTTRIIEFEGVDLRRGNQT